jgi:hypothetical protein
MPDYTKGSEQTLMFIKLKRLFFKILRKNPAKMPMVQYWKHTNAVQAKVMEIDGVTVMKMDGEPHIFPGFPRGWLLYGKLSKLKHEVKNQIFNDNWSNLETNEPFDVRRPLQNIYELMKETEYDLLPPSKMVKPVREIHRAWTKIGTHLQLRDLICFILQEDDSYRFRLQWLTSYFPILKFFNPARAFIKVLPWLEHGEIIGDMKERQRLFRRIITTLLEDENVRQQFNTLFREIRWRKVKLSKADKYFFRGKYYKVDLDKFDY